MSTPFGPSQDAGELSKPSDATGDGLNGRRDESLGDILPTALRGTHRPPSTSLAPAPAAEAPVYAIAEHLRALALRCGTDPERVLKEIAGSTELAAFVRKLFALEDPLPPESVAGQLDRYDEGDLDLAAEEKLRAEGLRGLRLWERVFDERNGAGRNMSTESLRTSAGRARKRRDLRAASTGELAALYAAVDADDADESRRRLWLDRVKNVQWILTRD